MATQTLDAPLAREDFPRWIAIGIASGAASVLLFHQGVAAGLHAWGIIPNAPFALQPTQPLGVPVVWSLVFWGGVWGAVLAVTLSRLHGTALLLASAAFGAILPSLVAWFVVAPIKERPFVLGVALALNAAWGIGTGLGLVLFGRHDSNRATP